MNVRRSLSFTLGILGFYSLLAATAQGPAEKGAVLRSPFDPVAPTGQVAAAPVTPSYLKDVMPNAAQGAADPNRRALNPDDDLELNRDLQLTPAAGNWLIMVISYPGKNGPVNARKMCLELRNAKRSPAFVFVYGAEERRKEYERVKKIIDEQQAFFKETNLWPDQPIRVKHQQIDVQHAVLMGGYPDIESANRALLSVRKWDAPDPNKVELETKFLGKTDLKDPSKIKVGELIYVNPYKRAIVCRNPTVKHEAPQEAKLDVAALRKLNSDEPLSLFNCKKPFTLAVKEYQTPFMMHDKDTPSSIWDTMGASKNNKEDFARKSAHNLADTLRKTHYDAYVLHAKFSSTVTVGSFNGPDDPELKATQEKLAVRFNDPKLAFSQVQFFHRPVPMAVPR